MSRSAAPSLEWVLHEGRPRPVSYFAGLAVGDRPTVVCPECERPVTLKLGKVRRHHAAHAPGDTCAAVHPETALHINVKCHIAAVLEGAIGGGRPLRVSQQCVGTDETRRRFGTRSGLSHSPSVPCAETTERLWAEGWDAVRLEHRVHHADLRRVPDIVLEKGGAAVGAIEVFVSHAVDNEKAAALAMMGLPWVEVLADQSLIGESGWSIDVALLAHREGTHAEWRCEAHQFSYDSVEATQQRRLVREAESARHTAIVTAARVVDVYGPGGVSKRVLYSVVESMTDGVLQTITLLRDQAPLGVFLVDPEPLADFRARVARLITDAYQKDVDAARRHRRVIADSPMRWAKGSAASLLAGSPGKHVRRYQFVTRTQRWSMRPELKDHRWDDESGMGSDRSADRAIAKVEAAILRNSRSPQAALEPRRPRR